MAAGSVASPRWLERRRPGEATCSAAAESSLAQQAPPPLRLDDIVGQDELVGPGRPLRVLVESDRLSSAIF